MDSKIMVLLGVIVVLGIGYYLFFGMQKTEASQQEEFNSFSQTWTKFGIKENIHAEFAVLESKNLNELDSIKKAIQNYSPKSESVTLLKSIYVDYLDSIIKVKEINLLNSELTDELCQNLGSYRQILAKTEEMKNLNESLFDKNREFIQKYPEFAEKINFNEIYFNEENYNTNALDEMISTAEEECK